MFIILCILCNIPCNIRERNKCDIMNISALKILQNIYVFINLSRFRGSCNSRLIYDGNDALDASAASPGRVIS